MIEIPSGFLDRNVARPAISGIGGVKGHGTNDKHLTGKPFGILRAVSLSNGPALWVGIFTINNQQSSINNLQSK